MSGSQAARTAARHVEAMTGEAPESITSLSRDGETWHVGVEVVETHRIPDSTDILAVYDVEVDDSGDLVGYRRDRRYYRGRAEG